MKTTIINLYGGPGTGKSTSAAYLFYLLKIAGENVELVREYVKGWAYEKRQFGVYDELYFLGKQVRHESMLFGKVKYIVTDAPVYMTAYYAKKFCSAGFAQGVEQAATAFYKQAIDDGHQHAHVYLKRHKPYQAEGRYQTEEQAIEVDEGVLVMLSRLGVSLLHSTPEEQDLQKILQLIQERQIIMEEKEIVQEEKHQCGGCQDCQPEEFSVPKYFDLAEEDTPEQIESKVESKLGTTMLQLKEALSKSVQERAEELTLEFANIAPLGDYGNLLEDNDSMAEFLKTEAHKPEHWKLYYIRVSSVDKELLSFMFRNTGVDDGSTFQGFVFTTKSGKIKHAFAQVES